MLSRNWQCVAGILALRVILEYHRREFRAVGGRYGEKSRLWALAALPTNVLFIYLAYVPFALLRPLTSYYRYLDHYLHAYLAYFLVAALGQGLIFVMSRRGKHGSHPINSQG